MQNNEHESKRSTQTGADDDDGGGDSLYVGCYGNTEIALVLCRPTVAESDIKRRGFEMTAVKAKLTHVFGCSAGS